MYRFAIEELKEWKNNPEKKPLIIQGARQVGKTWLMKEFGNNEYEQTIYINFDSNQKMKELFSLDLNIDKIIKGIEIFSGSKIEIDNTLIIFDEIQEVPRALASLKYFAEDERKYNIICAGSLLGIALHNGTSFPVGKVDFLKLYPLSFKEFLLALGKDEYVSLIDEKDSLLIKTFKDDLIELLKKYYYIGGMPEVVKSFAINEDYSLVREIQKNILQAYEQDFSKHAPNAIVPRIRMVWNSIPSQLAKENKKFIYGALREGARAKEFETAIMWLEDCGLIYKVHRINSGHLPSKAYEDLKSFKIYLLDTGLLCCMTGINERILLDGNDLFVEFKGALTEQYVLQQLVKEKNLKIYYYASDTGQSEVDFIVDNGEIIFPIEVKAEVNLKAKSLKVFIEKFMPKLAIRLSISDYKKENHLTNIPLYLVEWVCEL